MTYIDANQHGAGKDFFGEVNWVEFTTNFGVYLLDDVWSHWHVRSVTCASGDNLCDDSILVSIVLEAAVEVLVLDSTEQNQRHSIVCDVSVEVSLEFNVIFFVVQLHPERLFDLDTQHTTSTKHCLVEFICIIVVPLLIEHDPLSFLEMYRFSDFHLPHDIAVSWCFLVERINQLRSLQYLGLHLDGHRFERNTPVFQRLLRKQKLTELLDLVQLLLRSLASCLQHIAHLSGISSDWSWNSINSAEFRR